MISIEKREEKEGKVYVNWSFEIVEMKMSYRV